MLPFTLLLTPNSSGLFSLPKAEFLLALMLLGEYNVLCCVFHGPFSVSMGRAQGSSCPWLTAQSHVQERRSLCHSRDCAQ